LACGPHGVVDLAGDVSLYSAHDFGFCPAFADAAGEVVAGGLVAAEPDNAYDVQGAVGVADFASVESVPHGFAAGCFDGRDSAEFGECGVGPDAFGVVARATSRKPHPTLRAPAVKPPLDQRVTPDSGRCGKLENTYPRLPSSANQIVPPQSLPTYEPRCRERRGLGESSRAI
jgi:hypothetical protein